MCTMAGPRQGPRGHGPSFTVVAELAHTARTVSADSALWVTPPDQPYPGGSYGEGCGALQLILGFRPT